MRRMLIIARLVIACFVIACLMVSTLPSTLAESPSTHCPQRPSFPRDVPSKISVVPAVLQTPTLQLGEHLRDYVTQKVVVLRSATQVCDGLLRGQMHPLFSPAYFSESDAPLTELGYPNLHRFLNEARQEGVRQDDNLAIDLLRLREPETSEYAARKRRRLHQALGIKDERANDLFQPWFDYNDAIERQAKTSLDARQIREQMREEESKAEYEPWTDEQCPNVAQWLDQNSKALNELRRILKEKDSFFEPMLVSSGDVDLAFSPPELFSVGREFQAAYRMRFNRRLGQDQLPEATADLRALHRLTCKVPMPRRHPSFVTMLMRVAAEESAYGADVLLLSRRELTKQLVRDQLKFYASLRPVPEPASAMFAFRCEMTSMLVWAAVAGPGKVCDTFEVAGEWSLSTNEGERKLGKPNVAQAPTWMLNWQWISDQFDQWIAEVEAVLRTESYIDRLKAAADFDRKMKADSGSGSDSQQTDLQQGKSDRSKRQRLSEDFAAFMKAQIIPPLHGIVQSTTRCEAFRRVVVVGYALTAFRLDKGHYPERLQDLVPAYIREVPTDPFTNGPLIYRQEGGEQLLYSVGKNQKDDQGRYDWSQDPELDDLTVKLPL